MKNRPITTKKIQSIINNLSKYKTPAPGGFTCEFYQTFKKEIMSILYTLLNRSRVEVRVNTSLNSLHLKIHHNVEVGQEIEANDKNDSMKNSGQGKGSIHLKSQKKNL